MNFEIVQVEPFRIVGYKILTCNADQKITEHSPISRLWDRFWTNNLPKKLGIKENPPIFGVYSSYESDHTGYFEVMAGVRSDEDCDDPHAFEVTIHGGTYLKFSFRGPLPDACIEGWGQVWQYFQEDSKRIRAYTVDFEEYLPDGVDIYIAINA